MLHYVYSMQYRLIHVTPIIVLASPFHPNKRWDHVASHQKDYQEKTTCALHHSSQAYAQDLITTWSTQSRSSNLPVQIQEALSSQSNLRNLRLVAALLESDEEDKELITEDELRHAVMGNKNSAPGDDGLTYQVLRLLQKVPGNPLLQLYNLCYQHGYRSTHHCLAELYSLLPSNSVIAFLDLKSAFDIANRDMILDQFVEFGVRGNLLKGINGYLTVIQDLPPWWVPVPAVTFTPTSKDAHTSLQKQLVLETISKVSISVPAGHHIYVDDSVQADGSAACAMFSPTLESPEGGWHGRRLPNLSSSTYCELQGIWDAVTLPVRRNVKGLVICDSESALQALTSSRPSCGRVVRDILCQLAAAYNASLVMSFMWMPSHIGLAGNDMVDSLAEAACTLDLEDRNVEPSLRCHKHIIYSAAFVCTVQRRDAERGTSVSIQHLDNFLKSRHKYRRRGLMVHRHNVVSARISLEYRPVMQVGQTLDIPHYTSCKLCNLANANNLEHYCLHCPTVRNLLPQGQNLLQTGQYLLKDDHLDVILTCHPHFGGC
ncbi:uncharacterized protein [Palaemon carinicauda]|uniref:uncharacterized protein n=1 Tax=Palaemon carinicauda TaxID=392227 RepID=UPI0035B62314